MYIAFTGSARMTLGSKVGHQRILKLNDWLLHYHSTFTTWFQHKLFFIYLNVKERDRWDTDNLDY